MKLTTRFAAAGAALTSLAVIAAGCAAAPEETGNEAPTASDYLPCLVSGTGGFNDKSFNESAFDGMTEAAAELGVQPITVESAEEGDYAPNIDQLVSQGCDLIVSVGFPLADATKAAATANPDIDFAIIDDSSIDLPNVKPILFETSQAAFLAGYAAASTSDTKVVGTFGGMQIPSVTIFMDGFADGVAHYNEVTGGSVKVLGWDAAGQKGTFTGGFAAGVEAKAAAQGLIDQGADSILPVGGPIFESAGEAIRDSGRSIALIGVDSDNFVTAPDLGDLFLTSVMKGVATGTSDVVKAVAAGDFSATPYVGTLENGGVGLAPFHDFEGKVSADLQAEIDALAEQIISGEIVVESPSNIG